LLATLIGLQRWIASSQKTAPRNDGLERGDTLALPLLESIRHNNLINKGKHFNKMTVDFWVNLSPRGGAAHGNRILEHGFNAAKQSPSAGLGGDGGQQKDARWMGKVHLFKGITIVVPLAMIVAGKFQDTIGSKKVIFVGGILFGAAIFLTGFVASLPMLYLTYGVLGGAGIGTCLYRCQHREVLPGQTKACFRSGCGWLCLRSNVQLLSCAMVFPEK
jgi:hypothetical protein